MFLAPIVPGALTQNVPIVFGAPKIITNGNVSLNETNNSANIVSPGWYKVRFLGILQAGTGLNVGVQLSVNSGLIELAQVSSDISSGDQCEVYIEYPIFIEPSPANTVAQVSVIPTVDATSVSGYIFIDKVVD